MEAIRFDNVSKYFNLYTNRSHSLKEHFLNTLLKRHPQYVVRHDVLKDVSFSIAQGESVGIIGANGTGKSTSLKLIANILRPDKGRVEVKGSVSSLLEIGAGFQPDLTGCENVFLYSSILGLSKRQVEVKYEEIVAFAELAEFMETPVKNYSSGMYMRLGFAVAIHVNPDIILLDEVLSVGDESFQAKCLRKIDEFRERGKTIVFVSHDMGTIQRICDRVFFVHRGGAVTEGLPGEMVELYRESISRS